MTLKMHKFILLIGWMVAFACAYAAPPKPSDAKARPPTGVIIQPVARLNTHTQLHAQGVLMAMESLDLTPKTANKIRALHLQEGQRVKKGQILVEMMDSEEQALLKEMRIQREEALKQRDRTVALVKQGAASQALLDERNRNYDAASAKTLALEARLNDMVLTAPFDALVGLRQVSEGAWVAPGQVITHLVDDSQMKMDLTLPDQYLNTIKIGASLKARHPAFKNEWFLGRVVSVDNQMAAQSGAIKLRALMPNSPARLMSGMLMQVSLITQPREALFISEAALIPLSSHHYVFKLKDDKVVRTLIEIGERLSGQVEIISGLQENDWVVTQGLQKIKDGEKINVLSRLPPASITLSDS